MGEHLAQNWGNWASVAGLIFSILAFVFSKRASRAAEEARDSVLRRSLSQDMNDAIRAAADVVRFVNMERGEVALLRVSELLNHTSYCITRWEAKHRKVHGESPSSSRQLSSMHEVLSRSQISELTPTQKLSLAVSSQQTSAIFSEEFGTAEKATDRM